MSDFEDRLRQLIMDVMHEWGYIDEQNLCGVRKDGTEYHNHEPAEMLARALVDFDPDRCTHHNPATCVRHHVSPESQIEAMSVLDEAVKG